MNVIRIWAIAHNAFRETIRDKILYLLLLFLLLMVGASLYLPQVAITADQKILQDVGLTAMHLIGLVVAVFVGTGLIFKEIDRRTVYILIAKPLTRAEFIVGKHVGLAALLSVLLAVMLAMFLLIVGVQVPGLAWEAMLISTVFMWLELVVIVAAALMFGVFTSSILATIYTLIVYLLGHGSRGLLQLADLVTNAAAAQALRALYFVLPDLERLNLRNVAVHDLLPPASELWLAALYGGVYAVALLAIATLVFSRRQF